MVLLADLFRKTALSSVCCVLASIPTVIAPESASAQDPTQPSIFVDSRDGESYRSVRIGTQTWMAENLRYETAAGSWCYGDDEALCEEYGRLYDWHTALSVCPAGWHLPNEEEWDALAASLAPEAGRKLREGGGSGFGAKMAGYRFYDGSYQRLEVSTSFWSSAPYTYDHSFERTLLREGAELHRDGYGVNGAVSVRCLREGGRPSGDPGAKRFPAKRDGGPAAVAWRLPLRVGIVVLHRKPKVVRWSPVMAR